MSQTDAAADVKETDAATPATTATGSEPKAEKEAEKKAEEKVAPAAVAEKVEEPKTEKIGALKPEAEEKGMNRVCEVNCASSS